MNSLALCHDAMLDVARSDVVGVTAAWKSEPTA